MCKKPYVYECDLLCRVENILFYIELCKIENTTL